MLALLFLARFDDDDDCDAGCFVAVRVTRPVPSDDAAAAPPAADSGSDGRNYKQQPRNVYQQIAKTKTNCVFFYSVRARLRLRRGSKRSLLRGGGGDRYQRRLVDHYRRNTETWCSNRRRLIQSVSDYSTDGKETELITTFTNSSRCAAFCCLCTSCNAACSAAAHDRVMPRPFDERLTNETQQVRYLWPACTLARHAIGRRLFAVVNAERVTHLAIAHFRFRCRQSNTTDF